MAVTDFKVTATIVTVTVTGQDANGIDVTAKTETASPGWTVWPATLGAEATQGEDIITDTLVALAPADAVLSPTSQVKVLGRTYEVQGRDWLWTSPWSGQARGRQLNLKAVSG